MPIPGLTTTYDFVDWLKYKKSPYHVNDGDIITLTGIQGGLIQVEIDTLYCGKCGKCLDCLKRERQ